jgi:superfamily II DNA/RNA helicase
LTFAALGVLPETVEALDSLGITRPFPIQSATIPVALSGSDVIGQAKTGTGKTLAFGIPVLQRVTGLSADGAEPAEPAAGGSAETSIAPAPKSGRGRARGRGRSAGPAGALAPAHGAPQALIVVPTRELAIQVAGDLSAAGKVRAVRVHSLYGGRAYEPQVEALRAGIDVAVGTPGRLLDLCQQKHLDLSKVRTLILDEADEMLDLGFLPDVERIIDQLPAQRQTMLFSATMPGQVISLARRYMTKPTHIRAADPDDHGTQVRNISQFVYRAHSLDKIELLSRVLQADGRGLAMVFARTKRTVAKVAEELAARHFAVAAVHGDLGQGAREQALRAFRNGKVDVLVATDVAARGIDVEGVTHVVNFQCPEDEKVYTHRIGRTGRAGNKGTAVTLVDWDEVPKWNLINKALDLTFADPPETYSTSPQLFSDLGIATGSKGVLPKTDRTRAGLAAEELEDLGETGRSRSPRGGGRAGERVAEHGAPKSAAEPRSAGDQPRAERTPRQRNRTRGGVVLQGAAAAQSAGESAAIESGAPDATVAPAATAPAATAPAAAEQTRPKRVRSRSAKSAAPKPAETVRAEKGDQNVKTDPYKLAPGSLAMSLPESVGLTAPFAAPATEAAKARQAQDQARANRTPTPKPATAAMTDPFKLAPGSLAASEPAAPVAPAPAEAPAEPARKRARTRKAAEPAAQVTIDKSAIEVATAPAGAAADLDVASAEPARKRTRARKTVEAVLESSSVESAVAAAQTVAAKPARERSRTRKPAQTALETSSAELAVAIAETTGAAEPARKRTRARKTAQAEPALVDLLIPAQSTAAEAVAAAADADGDAPVRAPRRRAAKKTVAAERTTAPRVNVSLPEPADLPAAAPHEDPAQAEPVELDPAGVANPRRTRI